MWCQGYKVWNAAVLLLALHARLDDNVTKKNTTTVLLRSFNSKNSEKWTSLLLERKCKCVMGDILLQKLVCFVGSSVMPSYYRVNKHSRFSERKVSNYDVPMDNDGNTANWSSRDFSSTWNVFQRTMHNFCYNQS